MDKKLNMAVVGAGYIGQIHAACIAQAENMELAAIVDYNEELGKATAAQFGCAYIKDAAELKDHPEIDAVNICVPEEYHASTAEICADAGKHILIEKPIAKTVEEAERIVAACERNGVRLMVEHTVHFVDDYRLLKNQYDAGVIGEVSQISIIRHSLREDMDRFKGRVSILYYIGVHDLEAVQWITGHKIVRVAAKRVDSMKLFGEEGYSILFEMDNGACGTMNVGWQIPNTAYNYDRIFIAGSKGVIDYDQGRNPVEIDTGVHMTLPGAFLPIDGKINGPYLKENVMFADAVMNGGEFLMDTRDAIYIIKVVEAIRRSDLSGKFEDVE